MAVQPTGSMQSVIERLSETWPAHKTVNIVCHGHSVPAGFRVTPEVDVLGSYPHLLRAGLAARFPTAVFNVIVTAKGGENSRQGEKRFASDVIALRPAVVCIDYALNDRRIGPEAAREAWISMIRQAQAANAVVILMTPTPDVEDASGKLAEYAGQVRSIAQEMGTLLVDSDAIFAGAGDVRALMSQRNHPNTTGHKLIAERLLSLFHQPGVPGVLPSGDEE